MLLSCPGALLAVSLLPSPAEQITLHFTDVTAEANLLVPPDIRAGGVSVGDFDGDGWQDIVVTGSGNPRPKFFRNRGAQILAGEPVRWFENVTPQVMPYGGEPSSHSVLADLDGDGDQDLVTVRRYVSDAFPDGNTFETGLTFDEWRDGRFYRVRTHPNLGRAPNRLGGLALGDVDRDGDLDIVFTHNGGQTVGGPGVFVRNDGIDRMLDATRLFGADLDELRRYFTPVLADFNGDGLLDLHVAVDFQSDYHCWGLPNGSFQDVTQRVGTTNGGSDMGIAVGDIENDGDLDIYSTNILGAVLYVNDGQGNFQDEGGQRGCAGWGFDHSRVGWGTTFFDADNDGDEDLMFVSQPYQGYLYENDGTGHFSRDVTTTARVRFLGLCALAFDFDRDGDLDLLIKAKWPDGLTLYENDSPALEGNHWLRVRLRGTISNTEGVGSKVEIVARGKRQMRAIMDGYSFNSGPPKEAHFGLGRAPRVELLRVTWPSGIVTTLRDLDVDREIVVTE